jgi:hypothetical protein
MNKTRRTRKLVNTSYAIALAIITTIAFPIPVWIVFVNFSYLIPPYAAEICVALPMIFNIYAVYYVTLAQKTTWIIANILMLGAIAVALTALIPVHWIIGKMAGYWLCKHYPWFKSVS